MLKKEKRAEKSTNKVDKTLLGLIIALSVFGLIAVFSASAPDGLYYHEFAAHYAVKHLKFLIAGGALAFLFSKMNYHSWQKWTFPIGIAVLVLLVATYIPALSKESFGASRWLSFIPVQPSELAKLSSILLAATVLSKNQTLLNKDTLKYFSLIAITIILVLFQPSLSISSIITLTTIAMMAYGGVALWLLGFMAIISVPLIKWKIQTEPYQLKRIQGWLNPFEYSQDAGYNIIQSWYAIASGGIFGAGFGQSKQKLFWLPFRHTDFIFAVMAEEFGFIGCALIIIAFLWLIYKGFMIAKNAPDRFGKLLAFGITFSIGLQAFINISVTTGVLPITGVTLPLISYGGTSLIVTLAMLGILLNISKKRPYKL